MIKFIKNNSKKFYIIGSAILLLMIASLAILIGSEFGKKAYAANTYTVTVNKSAAVTVYVSGKGVTPDRDSSTDNTDVYLVEQGTSIALRAVNESRILKEWTITGTYTWVNFDTNDVTYDDKGNITSIIGSKIEITPTSNLTISTVRRDALTADYGEYMNAKFTIALDTHLMYLQKIFEAGNDVNKIADIDVLKGYDHFFEKYSVYEDNIFKVYSNETDASLKAQKIKDGNYFAKIQKGYFKVSSSFSLLNETFKGIGSEATPFMGVLCGSVESTISTIFITSSGSEVSGNMYRGLFQVLGDEGVVRNINIRTSLGIKASDSTPASNIYVGGIAGKINNSVISNVDVLARLAVDAKSANIYAGSVAGELNGGLDKGRSVTLNGEDSTFILTTNASGANIYAGLISGDAKNVYVKEVNANTSNFAISAKNTASNIYSADTNVYLGNLFGKYTATSAMPIENVKITGSSKESITSLISSGNSYIGGLIGYLDVSDSTVALGDVSITNTSGESKLSGSSVNNFSQTNILTAGLIACVKGSGLNPTAEFLDGAKEKTVDGVTHYEYEYIFNTDLLIQSVNNGQIDGSSFGKTIATGFIARGYMNLNGSSDTDRNEIFLSSGKYKTKVYATQSSTSKNTVHANDQEHCIATGFYGNLNNSEKMTLQSFNVYISNFDIIATRELGSLGMSDVHAAGLIGFSKNVDLKDLTLYLNNSNVKGHSLSYEVQNSNVDINNCYVGGLIGAYNGNAYNSFNKAENIKIAGNYNHTSKIESGTTSVIEGIQNTLGGDDYRNENYVGGVIGRLYHAHCNGIYYVGSPSNKDMITSLTHENPASAFCGGVIGYVKNNNSTITDVFNAEITNASIFAGATVVEKVGSHPDIYVGGLIGATYNDENSGTLRLFTSKVINTSVVGEGFEKVMLFVGGAIGTVCWAGSAQISDVYVVDSNIESNLIVNIDNNNCSDRGLFSCASGIMARSLATTTISNCAVIDTNISSNFEDNYKKEFSVNKIKVSSSGIYGDLEGSTVEINNCYSNASLESTGTDDYPGSCFGISDAYDAVTPSNAYYVLQNANSTISSGTPLDFSSKHVAVDEENASLLFSSLTSSTSKYYVDVDDTSKIGTMNSSNITYVYAHTAGVSSFADIWINAKASGDTSKNPSNYATETELIEAGWFKLGSLIIYNGSVEGSFTKSETTYSFVSGSAEYVLHNNGTIVNKFYPYDSITNPHYTITDGNQSTVKLINKDVETTTTIEGVINANIVNNMYELNIALSMSPASYTPVLFNSKGELINKNGLSSNEYGTFNFTFEKNSSKYLITYAPNENINYDDTIYIGFINESEEVLANLCYKIIIKHNITNLVGLTYADYTKPINYQDISFIDADLDGVIDTVYNLLPNKTIKILPVFEMSNNLGEYIISELNISKVTYSSDSGTIKANGEFLPPLTGNGTITVSFTENGQTKTMKIHYLIVPEIEVTYSIVGADVDALNYATVDSDYAFDMDLLDHYGGDPIKFDVTVLSATNYLYTSIIEIDSSKYVSKIRMSLIGENGEVAVYGSTDGGENWENVPLGVVSTTDSLSDREISLKTNNYNRFKIVSLSESVTITGYSIFLSRYEYQLTYSNETDDSVNAYVSGDVAYTREINLVANGFIELPEVNSRYYKSIGYRLGNGKGSVKLQVKYENSDTFVDLNDSTVTHDDAKTHSEKSHTINANNVVACRIYVNEASSTFRLSDITYTVSNSNNTVDWNMLSDDLILNLCSYTNLIVCIQKTNAGSEAAAIFTFVDENSEFDNVTLRIGNASGVRSNNKVIGADTFISTTADKNVANNSTNAHPKIWSAYNANNNTAYEDRYLEFASEAAYLSSYNYRYLIIRIPGDGPTELRIESVIVQGSVVNRLDHTLSTVDAGNNKATFEVEDYESSYTVENTYFNGSLTTVNNASGLELSSSSIEFNIGNVLRSNWVSTNDGQNVVSMWNIENTDYTLNIPQEFLYNNWISKIEIDIEFPIVYSISFELQSDSFNPEYTGETYFTFKAKAGTKFGTLFGTPNAPTANLQKLLDAVKLEQEGGVKKFGFVFGGFYLIDSGNSLEAYSTSFYDLLNKHADLEIYSSYMYYGRWSFLVELIEAPGTDIKTSFEAGYMEDVGLTEEEKQQLQLNDKLSIPINNNRGYIFTVDKEEGFIGEAQVNAYIVENSSHIDTNGDGYCDICNALIPAGSGNATTEHIREITVEKYHNNMYLYYIPPEEITGYLVIVSNVTNSSIIVGKNTASVTEQILPEDGIYTFKYVVNHKKDKSYIYDSTANLLGLKRNILIEFFDQVYDTTNKETTVASRTLVEGTTIEVYYSLYEDGDLTEQTIGVYTAVGGEESIKLSQFKKWNKEEDAFNNNLTFSQLLSGNTTTSEVYYFVVTPPNGQNTGFKLSGNEIINEVIYVGYCKEEFVAGEDKYISGIRSDNPIINKPIEGTVTGVATVESARHEKIYSVTPSRQTNLTMTDASNYTFTDIKTYHVIDLNVTNGSVIDNKLVLSDSALADTIITSSEINGCIREIGLKLGYGTGLVKVSGSINGTDFTPISTFLVDSVDYKYYYVDFESEGTTYKYFKVDNISLNDIRLESFSYNTINNAMNYEFNISDAIVDGDAYSFVNEIKGDTRHDGKTFMLAVEYTGVVDISTNVSITVTYNGGSDTIKPLLSERKGKVVAYYNLSQILKDKNVTTIDITLNNDTHSVEKVRLLEATSALKPAVSEERVTYKITE